MHLRGVSKVGRRGYVVKRKLRGEAEEGWWWGTGMSSCVEGNGGEEPKASCGRDKQTVKSTQGVCVGDTGMRS